MLLGNKDVLVWVCVLLCVVAPTLFAGVVFDLWANAITAVITVLLLLLLLLLVLSVVILSGVPWVRAIMLSVVLVLLRVGLMLMLYILRILCVLL